MISTTGDMNFAANMKTGKTDLQTAAKKKTQASTNSAQQDQLHILCLQRGLPFLSPSIVIAAAVLLLPDLSTSFSWRFPWSIGLTDATDDDDDDDVCVCVYIFFEIKKSKASLFSYGFYTCLFIQYHVFDYSLIYSAFVLFTFYLLSLFYIDHAIKLSFYRGITSSLQIL